MGGEKEYRERATAYAPETTISTSGGVALQISPSPPKNRTDQSVCPIFSFGREGLELSTLLSYISFVFKCFESKPSSKRVSSRKGIRIQGFGNLFAEILVSSENLCIFFAEQFLYLVGTF